MKEKNEALPSKKESRYETARRMTILKNVIPELRTFSQAIIIVGSIAFGRDYSITKNDDIDILVFISRKDVSKIFGHSLFNLNEKRKEPIELFMKGAIDTFTFFETIDGVVLEIHFWNKESHYKAEKLGNFIPKRYTTKKEDTSTVFLNFSGEQKNISKRLGKKLEYGYIREFPAYKIIDGEFVPMIIINNLVSDPDVVFTDDVVLYKNIDFIWEKLIERLIKESEGNVDLSKKSVLFCLPGNWAFSQESRKKIENRTKEELNKFLNKNDSC